jgi:putative hydroxymethylpyrimidine transport system permease protein
MRLLVTATGLILIWAAISAFCGIPPYMLPAPWDVAGTIWSQAGYLATNAGVTLAEIGLGMVFGTALGMMTALGVAASRALQRWLMPLLVLSQAVPAFTLAPLLVLWLGFGLASKVTLAVLVIFFPVTANFLDGLRRTEPGWLALAHTMNASPLRVLLCLRLPAALPALGSGLRVAAAVAPIGAVLGEWAGASSGLGYVMINADARAQTDLMFAALVLLACMALGLYAAIDHALRRLLRWAPGA